MKKFFKWLRSLFKKTTTPKEMYSDEDVAETGETINDAKEFIKSRLRASDLVKIANEARTKVFKDAEEYIPTLIECIEEGITDYAKMGITHFEISLTDGFTGYRGRPFQNKICDYFFNAIKKDFESRGFIVEKSSLNGGDTVISWKQPAPEDEA